MGVVTVNAQKEIRVRPLTGTVNSHHMLTVVTECYRRE